MTRAHKVVAVKAKPFMVFPKEINMGYVLQLLALFKAIYLV